MHDELPRRGEPDMGSGQLNNNNLTSHQSHIISSLLTHGGVHMAIYHTEKEFWQSFTRYNALSSPRYLWHTAITEKMHSCEFGCTIPSEETFFKKPLDADGERAMHVCWDCMERMVYLTVDADLHAKELTKYLQHQMHAHQHEHALRL